MTGVFGPAFEELPAEIPIFPLTGVLLLPGGKLPMNIFEPRYLNMTSAALAGDRMIGMIQPVCDNEDAQPDVYQTGCVGRLTSFSETEDGRYLIIINGISLRHPWKCTYKQNPAAFALLAIFKTAGFAGINPSCGTDFTSTQ